MPNDLERKFNIGPAQIRQQGRISEITHPTFGQTYLVEVTHEQDLSDQVNGEIGDVIREMLGRELFNGKYHETFSRSNGTLAVISQRLSADQRPNIYLGQDVIFDDEGNPDLTSTLEDLSFRKGEFYVPMSVYPEAFVIVVGLAEQELKDGCIFTDLHKKFIPKDSNPPGFYNTPRF